MQGYAFPDVRVLIVPGLNNSGPDHWQTQWQLRYPHFERVEQVRWEFGLLQLQGLIAAVNMTA